ncbi:MAG TPA: molybdopterin-dependent oxidoreductase [Sedimentibacter sp.]|jgi:DMSO/TMAO reductase YedYZ molybdopterin-dependent catalytic subunit|nr:molybdopterin-dependent oxidoreductase [Sedimentibacter sp.]HOK49791.1 molybdopterin-dependent oxidoreductase [Sedimentibacter sp.]HOW22288.1 molybdopterin-dependent oxidoreductase [Sedimentibacter sp.]HRC80362.1 molybdopterin-dependent oxidoreductase [Sedimentibacter sp.]
MTYKQHIEYLHELKQKIMLHRHRLTVILTLVFLLGTLASGCAAGETNATSPDTPTGDTIVVTITDPPDELEPIVVPTMPDVIPPYLGVDPETGLIMTGTPVLVDFDTYRLKVSGKVDQELSLTYDDLRRMPKLTATPTLECVGYFKDVATWSGASLKTILEMAKVQPEGTRVVFKGADGYQISMILENALAPENFLAYELEGKTLPVLQGFPLRVVIPSYDGAVWVKWLLEIVVE